MEINKIIDYYHNGTFTGKEMLNCILENINESNIKEIVNNSWLMGLLEERSESLPKTDDEWDRLRTFTIGSYIGYSKEKYDEWQKDHKKQLRFAIELVRGYF